MSIGRHHNPVALKDEWLTPQHGEGAFFILKDCRDLNTPHLCLFPEFLKHELREIRSTIEAYSQAGKMGGAAEASACGLKITKGHSCAINVRITDNVGNTIKYRDGIGRYKFVRLPRRKEPQ